MHDLTLVISDLGSGGAQRVVTALANAWTERGLHLCVVTLAPPESDFFTLDARITRLSIGGLGASHSVLRAVRANFRRILALRWAIRQADAPTVVAFVGVTNVLTILAAAGLGMRVVISERNDPAKQSLGRVWDALRRSFYRHADLVTANSRGALEALRSFVPERKLAFVPNPLALAPRAAKSNKAVPTILTVGRLSCQKAHDVLLSAFARVAANAPGWRLAVVGEGELEDDLRQQAETVGVADRVDWVGRANDPFIYYRRADIFVLASRFEGTPNAVLEAMSCGLPVVVSSSSAGALDLVEDGVTGLVVPVDDVTALAEALSILMRDPALRQSLGKRAQARVQDHGVDNVLSVWERLLNLRHKPC